MNLSGKTNSELGELRESIEREPSNQQTGSIFRFTPSARRKLDAIALAITENLRRSRIAAGQPINTDGYSGRQTNRR
jgi:hypothetical protein